LNYPDRFNNNIRVIKKSNVDDLIKIENFKYDKVYFGSPTKYEKGIDLNRELFVTPFKGCASIFCLPRDPITRKNVMGIPRGNYNLNYDEWKLPDDELIQPLDKVHVRVEGMPDIPEHEVECLGHIHEIDMSKYKDNIYIKPWMSGENREFLIVGVNHIEFTNIIEHSITASIVGCSSNRFNNESTTQEGATMDNNKRFLTFEDLEDFDEHGKISESENNENTNNHEINLKIKKGNEIIGKADIYHEDDGVYLGNFEIFPKYRGRGYANTAMIYLINDYHIDTLVVVKANTVAINLYKKFGFTVDQEYYAKDLGCDVYYMKRTEDDIPDNMMRDKDNDIMLENQNVKLNKKGHIFESGDFEGYGKDVNLEEHNTDPIEIGIDDNDVHNEYDQKDIDTLNELIASEQSAIGEYLDAAKNTNVDILRRLYSDIGDEERFHSEQLMFAKASITGEKYEPRDPEVKKEYEELLAMGMDEETAMTTAIDKRNIMEKDDGNDSDIEKLNLDISVLEESFRYYCTNDDLIQAVCESSIEKYDDELSKQLSIFAESYLYTEAVDNVLSNQNSGKNPISLILNGAAALFKFVSNLVLKLKDFIKRISIKQGRINDWIKKNGIKGIFQNGVYLYYYSPDRGSVRNCIEYAIYQLKNYTSLLYNIMVAIGKKVGFEVRNISGFDINHNIKFNSVEDGLNKIKGVVMSKTKIVVTDSNESDLKELFFGNPNNINIYNLLNEASNRASDLSKTAEEALNYMKGLESNTDSIYYKNRNLYNWGCKSMGQVISGFKTYTKALVHDINQVAKLNKGVLEQTKQNSNNTHDNSLNNNQNLHW